MDISRTKTMAEPQQWWKPFIDWLTDNTVVLGSFAVVWRGIDKTFKYLSEGRDARTKQIVKDEIEPLNDKIDHLTEMFYDFKKK